MKNEKQYIPPANCPLCFGIVQEHYLNKPKSLSRFSGKSFFAGALTNSIFRIQLKNSQYGQF